MLPFPEKIDKSAVLRYLGYSGAAADDSTDRLIGLCTEKLMSACSPSGVYREFSLSFSDDGISPEGTGLVLTGSDIARHLDGCERCLISAATLGIAADRLISSLGASDAAASVVTDCCASVLIEQVCALWLDSLRKQYAERGLFLTSMYSPGYGDLPLGIQRQVLALTDAQRRIGLTLTSTDLMTPRKSITSIIGVSDHPVTGRMAGCENCKLKDKCRLRKEGKSCANK
jgi:hypothetical protein